jgi:hypothetical protein
VTKKCDSAAGPMPIWDAWRPFPEIERT